MWLRFWKEKRGSVFVMLYKSRYYSFVFPGLAKAWLLTFIALQKAICSLGSGGLAIRQKPSSCRPGFSREPRRVQESFRVTPNKPHISRMILSRWTLAVWRVHTSIRSLHVTDLFLPLGAFSKHKMWSLHVVWNCKTQDSLPHQYLSFTIPENSL